MAAPEAADLTFDTALFVRPLWPRLSEEAVKAVVRAQGHEALGLDPVAAL